MAEAIDTEVVILGAGPTGLVLALWLRRLGIRLRILDKALEPGTTSRALAVQARTLEFYRQLGFADEVVNQGQWATGGTMWAQGRKAAHINFNDMGQGISPYPYPLVYPQDQHERLLIRHLEALGIVVERGKEVFAFEQTDDRVQVHFKSPDGSEETITAAFLAGCDGARSIVRERLGIGFPGGTYEHLFYVADVEASGETLNGGLNVAFGQTDFLVVFPLKDNQQARFIGTVRNSPVRDEKLSWQDVDQQIVTELRTDVQRVNWFSTYRVHHRVANHFRKGRCFLLGDAAHIHSPVGGQGMNTGIGDAVNLSWKLAAVLRGKAKGEVLDTYEVERIAFARRLVATTDQAFVAVTSTSALARWTRLRLMPLLAPLLFSMRWVRRLLFRTVSQANVNYRHSPLSRGRAGSIRGGDRLPWVGGSQQDNFQPLQSLNWQLHIYGEVEPASRRLGEATKLPLHVFPWTKEVKGTGLARNAIYLIRPDGYVAIAVAQSRADEVMSYLRDMEFSAF